MSTSLLNTIDESEVLFKNMQSFGEVFIEQLPKHFSNLNISNRLIEENKKIEPLCTQIDNIRDIQNMMMQVLKDPITIHAQNMAEKTFQAFLSKKETDIGMLKFFNGWNETHKTTSQVSAKIIMRLAADAIFIEENNLKSYLKTMCNMYEVAKDDFGLCHKGHDGMYVYMTDAFNASNWIEAQYKVKECNDFSQFLYNTGVSHYTSPLNSDQFNQSILEAMMVSISSELWNGREYNYFAQFIEKKLLSYNPNIINNISNFRNAKSYVLGHAGEIENKHGLHAFAAATIFSNARNLTFDLDRLKKIMLNYNYRVGLAFSALYSVLTA